MEEKQKRVLSLIQPSGIPTLGNYLGALKNWSDIADEYECAFGVADLHAITVRQDPQKFRKQVSDMYALLLALDLKPEKNILFVQSQVPTHAQMGWILDCYTQFGEMSRMTQFKDKSKQHADNVNVGLFSYPALMAGDILLYQADYVPVGADQKQHLELCRDIAQRFNGVYGDVFTIPEPLISKTGARIMSLQEPESKMSKSDLGDGSVFVLDDPDTIRRKIKRAVTDSETEIRFDPENKPGVSNLLTIISALSGESMDSVCAGLEGQGYGALKARAADCTIAALEPLQAEYKRLMADKDYLMKVQSESAQKAAYLATKTLRKVQKKIGFAARP